MPFYRWTTFQDLLALQERMNRILEEAIRRGNFAAEEREPGHWAPACDVYETAGYFHLNVELAGVDRSDIDLQVAGDRLVIKGTRRTPGNEMSEAFVRMERTYGPFRREFHLPAEVDSENTAADFVNGVLAIRIPMTSPRSRAVNVVPGGTSLS